MIWPRILLVTTNDRAVDVFDAAFNSSFTIRDKTARDGLKSQLVVAGVIKRVRAGQQVSKWSEKVIVNVSLAEFEPSRPVIVIEFPGDGDNGAAYRPLCTPIDLALPPFADIADHVAFGSVTPFRVAENCTVPPAGAVDTVGLIEKPEFAKTVTVAVLEVTVVAVESLVCWATAVISTCPLFVEHTVAGTV